MASTLVGVLFLDSISESIKYRAYLDLLEKQTLLEWWVERVQAMPGVDFLMIVCHTDKEEKTLKRLFPQGQPAVFKTRHFSERQALAELAAQQTEPVFAVFSMGFALCPRSLLEKMLSHHHAVGNSYTTALGLPQGTAPVLLQKKLLIQIEGCGIPGLPHEPVEAAEALMRAAKSSKQALPFPIHWSPFDAATAYAVELPRLPRKVSLVFPYEVALLKEVLNHLGPTLPMGLEALEAWKACSIKEAQKRQAAIQAWTLPAKTPRPAAGKKRILYVSNPSGFSGAEESLCQMMNQLDAHLFEKTALIARDGVFADRLRASGARVVTREADFGKTSVDNLYYGLAVLQDMQADIVHLNGPQALPLVMAANLLHIPVVLHVRNGEMTPYEEFVKSVDAFIAISEFVKREILAFDIDPQKVHLIPDEADVDYFKNTGFNKQTIRRELGVPTEAKVALMIARFAPNKRHDLMLEAAALVRKTLPSFHLVMKSDVYSKKEAELLDSVQARVRRLDLAKTITWLRFVPDIRQLHALADILVLCSDREGMGRCVVEAMAMELPVVVTDSGGSHELTGQGERGYVVKGGDVHDLAQQIVTALTQESQSKTKTYAARRFAETYLNAQRTAAQVAAIYQALSDRKA